MSRFRFLSPMKPFLSTLKPISSFHRFLFWNTSLTFFSSCSSVLGTDSLLLALGKGSGFSNATYNFIGKDIIGQLGGLCVSFLQRKQTDRKPSMQGSQSLFLQQSSIVTEMVLPFLPASSFLWVAGGANVMKNISWIGTGAFVNQLMYSFVKGNVGELYTLVSVCNTLSSSVGLGVGTFMLKYFPSVSLKLVFFSGCCVGQWICFYFLRRLWSEQTKV